MWTLRMEDADGDGGWEIDAGRGGGGAGGGGGGGMDFGPVRTYMIRSVIAEQSLLISD